MAPLAVTACPLDAAQSVGIDTVLRLHAGVAIDPSTVAPTSVGVIVDQTAIAGAVAVSGQDLTFVPAQPLPPGRPVSVTVAPSVRDVQGRSLSAAVGPWGFVTGSGPGPFSGFVFSPPMTVPSIGAGLGQSVAADGESAVLAASSANIGVVETPDGLSFLPPAVVGGPGGYYPKVAVAGGVAHVTWQADCSRRRSASVILA